MRRVIRGDSFQMPQVLFGIDQVLSTPGMLNGRLGLLTNDAARTALDSHLRSRVALQRAGFNLVHLFSPEHGLEANTADGAAVGDGYDTLTGIPVVSLYGKRMHPPPESLADLDAVVFDIQDIGARFYTYIWTLSHLLEACAEAGVPLVVLDRPNPLGGDLAAAEGPTLDVTRFGSFVGRAAIPIRHSLTVGELAQLWNAEWKRSANLRVVPCCGWTRAMHWPDTGLPFVQTSPAIASYESALLYPGLCLFEATNLSVGRGTSLAFQAIGAPWLKAAEVTAAFNALKLSGIRAETTTFTPSLPPYLGTSCSVVRMRLTEPCSLQPVRSGLHLLATTIATHWPDFQWASYPTVANPTGEGHFERLIGQAGIRETLESNPPDLAERIEAWTTTPGWRERVAGCLLYA
jgi:uncharacterized protein YbbC (DUF1343 family)